MNLAPFIGSCLGSVYGGPLSDFHILRLSQRNKGIYEPEMRFWLALPWIVVTPLSLLMFGLCLAHVSLFLASHPDYLPLHRKPNTSHITP